MLEQLRAERNQSPPSMEHTIGGPIQRDVHSNINRERDSRIAHGEQSMQDALQNLRHEQAFATREGLAQAHFNQAKEIS